jgi:hypothetical protein
MTVVAINWGSSVTQDIMNTLALASGTGEGRATWMKMRVFSLVAIAIAIAIFWTMLSMIFESVVFNGRSEWGFLPWYFCDIAGTVAGVATFAFVYILVMKR